MRNRFDRELVRLNNELIEIGSMIEKSIETAVKAMVNQDVELANRVIEADDAIDPQEAACCKRFTAYIVCIKDGY